MNNARIQEVLFKVDILKLVRELSHLTCSGDAWIGLCPFHAEKTPSFQVYLSDGIKPRFYHCFGCKKEGDAISFIMGSKGISFLEALDRLFYHLQVDEWNRILRLPIDDFVEYWQNLKNTDPNGLNVPPMGKNLWTILGNVAYDPRNTNYRFLFNLPAKPLVLTLSSNSVRSLGTPFLEEFIPIINTIFRQGSPRSDTEFNTLFEKVRLDITTQVPSSNLVRTPGFQPANEGSTPPGTTNTPEYTTAFIPARELLSKKNIHFLSTNFTLVKPEQKQTSTAIDSTRCK